jgi:OPA family glycerol-3-phosphate transporter-like MFS transporter
LLCGGLVFGVGAMAGGLLIPVTGHHALLSILCCAVLTGCMHGVNVMLICMIPPFFKQTGRVSTVSGLLNACTYVGSALSTYGVALLSEQFDWSVTLWVWLGIAVMGTLVCLCTVKPWKRFVKENIPD